MSRSITVKGIGKLSLKPDQTVISLTLRSFNKVYDKAMDDAADHLDRLRAVLVGVGFAKDDLKTADFNVGTEYESRQDRNGSYKRVFVGYVVTHGLKLEFDFDTQLLSKTLGAIAACVAEPELSVRFTVKDKDAVSIALLESVCVNAKAKAEILARASGVKLGSLVSIDYSWGELHLYSPTHYEIEERCIPMPCAADHDIEIEPDDIDVIDSVTFVWEIE